MADQLATPQDLASFLQLGVFTSLTAAKQATIVMLVELATSKVQRAAGGQRILEATSTGAVIDLQIGYDDCYVPLPQRPVRSVASVALNGVAITDYYLRSQMLWRAYGWQYGYTYTGYVPPQLTVTYTHGHPAGSQALQFARTTVMELARGGWGNPLGQTSKAIDDYRVTYAEADARMVLPIPTAEALASAYGTSAYTTASR
jgi:hypothetical protein